MLAFIIQAVALIPELVKLGRDVAPFVSSARAAIEELVSGDPTLRSREDFAALDTQVRQYEDELQRIAAERRG